MNVERERFVNGLVSHFKISKREAMGFVDHLVWAMSKKYTLNIIKFDDYLIKKFGDYMDGKTNTPLDNSSQDPEVPF